MKRGTTQTHTFDTDIDLTGAEVVFITYKQNGRKKLEKRLENITINPNNIQTELTQVDTLRFTEGKPVEIQIRARFPDNTAVVSNIMTTTVEKLLKGGEI